jgi:hypothetical protein
MTGVVLPVEPDRADGRVVRKEAPESVVTEFAGCFLGLFSAAMSAAKQETRQGTFRTACYLNTGYAWYSRSKLRGYAGLDDPHDERVVPVPKSANLYHDADLYGASCTLAHGADGAVHPAAVARCIS